MNNQENELWPKDKALIEQILAHPFSINEKLFFTKMKEKMEHELAPCKEVHFSERDNDDGIFLLRDGYDEFILGTDRDDVPCDYIHVMSLSEALTINLKDIGYTERDITLIEWLRERDYQGAMFDHNNAYL